MQAIPGVPKLEEGLNPATWMLQISTPGMESNLGVDFNEKYRNSKLFQCVALTSAPLQFGRSFVRRHQPNLQLECAATVHNLQDCCSLNVQRMICGAVSCVRLLPVVVAGSLCLLPLFRRNEELIEKLSVPPKDAQPLHFDTEYPQGYFAQFNQCLWKFWLSYWRNAPCAPSFCSHPLPVTHVASVSPVYCSLSSLAVDVGVAMRKRIVTSKMLMLSVWL